MGSRSSEAKAQALGARTGATCARQRSSASCQTGHEEHVATGRMGKRPPCLLALLPCLLTG